jgi:flagellin
MNIQGLGFSNSGSTSKTLGKTTRALQKVLEQLSTGKRINRASDDAAGLAVSEMLSSQVRGFKMAENNVSDAMSALNIGDGAANEISDILQRQRELAIQSSNGTLTNEQRGNLNVEYQQLKSEMDRITGVTNFNTQSLIDGQGLGSGNAQIQAGPNASDATTLPRVDLTTVTLGLGPTDIGTQQSATSSIDAIDNAFKALNTGRSTIGATVNRFESTMNNLSVSEINTQAAESVIRDQDVASGMAELVRQQLLLQSGTSAFKRFNDVNANHIMALLQ